MKLFSPAAIMIASALLALQLAPTSRAAMNNNQAKLMESVTLDAVVSHLNAFQSIADTNNGHRYSGTPGYDHSATYVANLLEAAGYNVTLQEFQYPAFISLTPSVLEQLSPTPATPLAHTILTYSGSGDVTAPVSVPSGDPRGCYASDFAGFPAGNIALLSRGSPPGFPVACTFAIKALNALSAGAAGVIIYNNVQGELNGTLGSDFTYNIPVVGVSQALGQQLAATAGLIVHLKTDTFRGIATTRNVLAETAEGDPANVVLAGAHLDSVNEGPGIQANGSGSAALLETALQMANIKTANRVRFAWWGGGEVGHLGSTYYLANLAEADRANLALYLNFDTIASPNHVFFLYDGDDSDAVGSGPGPQGSAAIEQVFQVYYESVGQPHKGIDLNLGSDHLPFVGAGIPVGGIYTGTFDTKTAEEAAIWGGTAGIPYDPCYHLACDGINNVSLTALEVNADAVAYSVLQFGMSTEAVNGKKGKGNFK